MHAPRHAATLAGSTGAVGQNPAMSPADDPIRLLVVEDSELDYDLLQAILLRDRETLGAARSMR
ncbi:MAG: hypothetical protein MUC68_17945 [Burkholderiaceae bacterium]|nr:hypothetical protein [Burkholderiaceae bacterium]